LYILFYYSSFYFFKISDFFHAIRALGKHQFRSRGISVLIFFFFSSICVWSSHISDYKSMYEFTYFCVFDYSSSCCGLGVWIFVSDPQFLVWSVHSPLQTHYLCLIVWRMVCEFFCGLSLSLFQQPGNCKFGSQRRRKTFRLGMLPDLITKKKKQKKKLNTFLVLKFSQLSF
jgi:hypothetical protein